ncbi:hypothetical protein KL942_005172 [Ogataea angusta]|uniref:Carboxylic ester hydrolase n=1 Tax=Pichia angusta TaxID=870730 RepID=A0ABQ7RQ84_PICAN|nr:hypothetical protein KL942_005172 [Ogataea angusta]KAG7845732.1 hypothetical protein KL940_005132 [Ogataea angusta]
MGQQVSTQGTTPYSVSIPGHGTLTGYTFNSPRTGNTSVHRFAKVPFAKPSTPENRFKLPEPLPSDYDYTGDYKEFGLKCPQPSVPHPQFRYTKSPTEENILYSNIWVPASDKYKPKDGWPVLIYIHGGFLQYSTPNNEMFNVHEMLDDEDFTQKFILVAPGYRLNMFGFLSSKELLEEDEKCSNQGFWDQRLAIEWTYKNIKHFGGNPDKITVGGISAGAYSAFFQLAYELYHPEAEQIIKQAMFFSNMVYVQPKTIAEVQNQFDEIIDKLGIDPNASSAEKLQKLRSLDTGFIEDFIPTLSLHTFRAVTDGHFISPNLIRDIRSGKHAKLLSEKGVRILIGEVDNELVKYSYLNTPQTVSELPLQVENYYPKIVVPTLMDLYGAEKLDENSPDFKEDLRKVYGAIISDGQVYASARGYINSLVQNGYPENHIYRYRISFRAKWLDQHISPDLNVPHACDAHLWFYCLREGYTESERLVINKWLQSYLQFVNFEQDIAEWPSSDAKKIRLFKRDGQAEYVEDPDWDWGVKVATAVYDKQIECPTHI